MEAEAPFSRSISDHLRGALRACHGAWTHTARLALDIALPTRCVACREPVAGEGVCAACWAKLSFIAPPFCARLGIPFVYDPGPGLLSMQTIADPPTYQRARAHEGPLDGAGRSGTAQPGRRAGTGAVALATGLEPALQSVRGAGASDRAAERRSGSRRRAEARQGNTAE